jgi:hypothetical protein
MVAAVSTRRSWGAVLAASALAACSGGKTLSPHDGVDASASDGGGSTDAPSGGDTAPDAGAAEDGGDAYECMRTIDCPRGQACDPNTFRCSLSCGAMQPCNGGCCAGAPDGSANGTCQSGALDTGCGYSGGQCTSCPVAFGAGTGGNECLPVAGGGTCGCSIATDCPPVSAGCDKTTGVCVFACSWPAEACLAGCCGGGKCEKGTSSTACGESGECADCTGSLSGSACVGGACGCQVATDCPAQYSCDPTTARCTMP